MICWSRMHEHPAKCGGEEMVTSRVLPLKTPEYHLAIRKALSRPLRMSIMPVAVAISDEIAGKYPRKTGYDFPDIRDGMIGMAFIETVVRVPNLRKNGSNFPHFQSKAL